MTTSNTSGSHLLPLRVNPGASRSEVVGFADGVLQVKIAAPPEKGKANRELIDFLSKTLGVKKSAVTIIRGQTGRNKLVSIEGFSPGDIIKRLNI